MLCGCAMSPDDKEETGNQLIVEFRVKGKINVNDFDEYNLKRNYFIAINCDNSDGSYGPVPIAGPSGSYGWGNGWGTSAYADQSKGITTFLQMNQQNSEGNVFLMIPGEKLRQYSPPITPTYCSLTDDGKGIRAIFDYSLLETEDISADNIKKLQVNIITTNLVVSSSTESTYGRRYDALGSKGEGFIDIIADRSYTYSGTDEDDRDISDEDLDITKWTIQVVCNNNQK